MSKNTGLRFFTDNRIDVTKRIEEGKTKAFVEKNDALEEAKKLKSYVYPLMAENKQGRTFQYGYAVPR